VRFTHQHAGACCVAAAAWQPHRCPSHVAHAQLSLTALPPPHLHGALQATATQAHSPPAPCWCSSSSSSSACLPPRPTHRHPANLLGLRLEGGVIRGRLLVPEQQGVAVPQDASQAQHTDDARDQVGGGDLRQPPCGGKRRACSACVCSEHVKSVPALCRAGGWELGVAPCVLHMCVRQCRLRIGSMAACVQEA